ncbi:MAG: hypothetical protein ACM3S0_12180 [Acidobacteriota bacterium]
MKTTPPAFGLYVQVLRVLEETGAPYMIIGGFAANIYGSNRATHDVDIVVQLEELHIQELVRRFPLPRYYADPYQMRDSIAKGIMFNIIDGQAGQKVDLVPLSMDPSYSQAFRRRVRLDIDDPEGRPMKVWVGRPDDIMIGKLKAWDAAHSPRHEHDIEAMLLLIYTESDPRVAGWYDERRVDREVRQLGPEASQLWQSLKKAARQAVKSRGK